MSDAARQRIRTGYAMIDATNAEALPLRAELTRFGTRQPACRALVREHFGVGELTAVAIWSSSATAVGSLDRCRSSAMLGST